MTVDLKISEDANILMKELGKSVELSVNQILADRDDFSRRKTKIICTMGPSCWSVEKLIEMIDAGMNVARLNFSHGDHETHGRTVQNLKAALARRPNARVSIMLDTKGPEIRTGMLKDGQPLNLQSGQELKIITDYSVLGDSTTIACSYSRLAQSVQVGGIILVADGTITLKVKSVGKDHVVTTVLNNAVLGERKNMNLPNVKVDLPVCGEREKNDILNFGIVHQCDMIAASFTQTAEDVRYIRRVLGEAGRQIKIIPKIENVEGILNFDEILKEADGIMVARGDMGMEIPPEKVFMAQKMMIAKCNLAGKPVITATQMLESMIKNPRPTRAEASDVANAVLDGTDCVMLSGESAGGAFPVDAVKFLAKVSLEAEFAINYKRLFAALSSVICEPLAPVESLSRSAVQMALDTNASALVVLSEGGAAARLASKYRPAASIIAVSSNEKVLRDMLLYRGIFPFCKNAVNASNDIKNLIIELKQHNLIKSGEKAVILVDVANYSEALASISVIVA